MTLGILVAFALLGANCANDEVRAAGTDPVVVTPESQGLAADRLDRIASVMKHEIDKGTIPGAVTLIARNGRIVHFEKIVGIFMAAAPTPRLHTRNLFKNLLYGGGEVVRRLRERRSTFSEAFIWQSFGGPQTSPPIR
jgi:hypothetical protein